MFKNSLFVFPVNENPQDICDFIPQTINVLKRNNNQILVVNKTLSNHWKDILTKRRFIEKKDNYIYYKYLYFLPEKFNKIIKEKILIKINKSINNLFIELLIFFISLRKKSYEWIFDPSVETPKVQIKRRIGILDIVDFSDFKKYKSNFERSDYIFANSQILKTKLKKITDKKIYSVPQGFDYKTFKETKIKKQKISNKKISVGFIGAISNRLDLNILINLTKKMPKVNFVFVGPIRKDNKIKKTKSKKIKELFGLNNVKKIRTQKKQKIPKIINKFDIAIIPYDVSEEFNLNSYPMKVFEYLYLGKPIISTPIKELKNKKFKDRKAHV